MAKTIMTVDDSASIRQMVSFTLQDAGFDVLEGKDGLDALNKLQSGQKVDMMFIDLNMPNMDGLTLLKEVRAMSQFKFIPLIMLTTEAQASKKQQGKEAGATGWIVKPFKPDQLLGIVKKVLK